MGAKADDVSAAKRIQAFVGELVGTFFLALVVSLAGGLPRGGIGIGMVLGAMLYGLYHVSGAMFNPAVTVAVLIFGGIDLFGAVGCILVQFIGAGCGALVGLSIAGTASGLEPFHPPDDLPAPVVSAFVAEMLFTFALALTVIQVNTKNDARPNSYFGFSIGFVLMAGALAVGGISHAVFNPAVATALDFAGSINTGGNRMPYLWLWWVAPLIGGSCAGLLNRYLNWAVRCDHAELSQYLDQVLEARRRGTEPPADPRTNVMPLRVLIVEVIGTFFLTFTAGMGAAPLGIGAIYIAMTHFGDGLSGAEFNPAVTIAALLRQGLFVPDAWKAALTIFAQFCGAIIGGFVAFGVRDGINFPNLDGAGGDVGAFAYEALITTLLCYTVLACTTQVSSKDDPNFKRSGHSRSFHGLAAGFVFVAGIYGAQPGGSTAAGIFNPAMGAGLCIAAAADGRDDAKHWWVYLFAPLVGALVGAGLFAILHTHEDMTDAEELQEALDEREEYEKAAQAQEEEEEEGARARRVQQAAQAPAGAQAINA